MVTNVDYNLRGVLLEELAGMRDHSERKKKLFEVIADIGGIIATLYPDIRGVEKLEDQLDNYESFDQEELEIISKGVRVELRHGLDRHPVYNRDTINQVFIALYKHLIGELKNKTLDDIADYERRDNMNVELGGVVRQLNIYHVLSSWVTQNSRSIGGLGEDEVQQAAQQFRDFKKSARVFVRGFRRLLRRSYNIESTYSLFAMSKNMDTYNDTRGVVEGTIRDCKRIASDSNSNVESNGIVLIRNFAEVIMLNAEYYFLQMGYEMLHDETARRTITDTERFEYDLRRDAFDSSKIRYLNLMPNGGVTIFTEVKKLAPEVREFYESLKPK